jgi:hypothetical protein
MSERFHVKFSFSGFIVLKNTIFKWPHPFLTFLWLSPVWRGLGPLFEQAWILFTKEWFVPSLIDFSLLHGSGEDFLTIFCAFLLFLLLSPLGKELSPSFYDTWIFSLKGWFVPSLVKIGLVVLEKKIFKWPHPIFIFWWLSPLWRGPGNFIWINLNSLHPGIICTKFDSIWPACSGEEDF